MNVSSYCTIESYECTNKSTILQGVKEEYTTSVQSYKPVLDSYQTSTTGQTNSNFTGDTTYSQPDSYKTPTTPSPCSKLGVDSQPLPSLSLRSKYPPDTLFQRETIDRAQLHKSNFMSHNNKTDNQCFKSQRAFQDRDLFYESPMKRRPPPLFDPPGHFERMPKLPSRRYSSPPFYVPHQQDLSDYQRQYRYHDSESKRRYNSSPRYSPLHSRGRSENILRQHSLQGRYETRSSFSSFEANRDVNCDQDYYETSGWNY